MVPFFPESLLKRNLFYAVGENFVRQVTRHFSAPYYIFKVAAQRHIKQAFPNEDDIGNPSKVSNWVKCGT